MSHRLIIDNVTKKYGEFHAVDHVSLEIDRGEFFTLLGPSGCGKTTLLRMIAGFNPIDGGEIYFDDRVINNIPADKRNIGMVFQNYAIFPHMTVRENVAYGLKARKIKGQELIKKTDEAMKLMQIYEYRDRMPSQLSGGQQQRVALARAIVITPGILLMDEPLSNLDAKLRVEMRTSIKKLQRQLGITTVYVTHDQEEALAISDRIAVISSGKIMQMGSPEEIYRHPNNAFVANFIGTSGFLDGKAEKGDVTVMNKVLIKDAFTPEYTGPVSVAVRPENIKLTEEDPNSISGSVSMSTFLGDFVNYEIQLDNGPVLQANEYSIQMRHIWPIGARVSIRLSKEAIAVFEAKE